MDKDFSEKRRYLLTTTSLLTAGVMSTVLPTNTAEAYSLSSTINIVDDCGAIGDGSASNKTINNEALFKAFSSGAKVIIVPPGNFYFDQQLDLPSGIALVGSGYGVSQLTFDPQQINLIGILGNNIDSTVVTGLKFTNLGSRADSNSNPVSGLGANSVALDFNECTKISIVNCFFEKGHLGIRCKNPNNIPNKNTEISISNCIFQHQASTGIYLDGCTHSIVSENKISGCGNDGIKTTNHCFWMIINNNISKNNGRDGFDFYSGLSESTVIGNLASGNNLNGFEIKGTHDSIIDDYVCRDNTFSGNTASRNKYSGFRIQSIRHCNFSGNIAISNSEAGFLINTVQSCTITGLQASKNSQQGFLLLNSSRNTFSSCMAVDNSWDDGVNQNGLYSGFECDNNSSPNTFSACMALNGTDIDHRGGQKHGMFFKSGCSNNSITGCILSLNLSNDLGDDDGGNTVNAMNRLSNNH